MKKYNFILCAFLFLLSQKVFSANAVYTIDGKRVKNIDYVVVGQTVEVEVKSSKKNVLVSGSFGKANSELKKFSAVKLTHKVSSVDLVRGYIILSVFFQEKKGGSAVDSKVETIMVTSLKQIVKDSKITDEQRAEQLFKEWDQIDDTSRRNTKEKDNSGERAPAGKSGRRK